MSTSVPALAHTTTAAERANPGQLTTRQCYQEMRNMIDTLTGNPEMVLSNGETVGAFLLRQWLVKELSKKKPSD